MKIKEVYPRTPHPSPYTHTHTHTHTLTLTLTLSLSLSQEYCQGFPGGSDGKRVCLQCRGLRFDPWVRKFSCRRKWQPTPVLLPGKSHGLRSLAGYSPWGCKRVGQRVGYGLSRQLKPDIYFTWYRTSVHMPLGVLVMTSRYIRQSELSVRCMCP